MIPRVTVSIPTYNRSGMLREALRSVLSQSLGDIEVIVSDNASTDDTPAVVAGMNDPRIRYIRHEEQIARHENFSMCLRVGMAPYVTMLCDDDLMLPENLERKVQMLDGRPDVGLVDSAFHVIGPHGEILRESVNFGVAESDHVYSSEQFVVRSLSRTCRITTFTVIRRSIIGKDRFEEADGPFCDFGLFLRLGRRANVAYIAEPLALLRFHGGAETVQAGMQEFVDDNYQGTLAKIALDQHVKKRFLDRFGNELADIGALRVASRSWARTELRTMVRKRSFPERRRDVTARLLREACQIEASVALSKDGWKLLMSSMIGPGGRALYRRVRSPWTSAGASAGRREA
jgi:glycosyltransferase involved in cell wall biosynthesis